MEEPKCRSIACRVPKPSIWLRLSRMIRTSGAVYGSFVEGVQRQLQSAARHLLLLSRLALLFDQLAHHLTPAGEFLSDPLDVVGNLRAITEFDIGEAIAAFVRKGVGVQAQGPGPLPRQGGTDHSAFKLLGIANAEDGVANVLQAGHAGDVDRLLGELALIDVVQGHLRVPEVI